MAFTHKEIAITRKSEVSTFLVTDRWLAQTWYTSPGDPGRVIESFEFKFTGTDEQIRTQVELLGSLRAEVDRYFIDPALSESIWFSITQDETYTRRALIYSIEFAPINRGLSSQALGGAEVTFFTIIIERDEVWENAVLNTISITDDPTFGGLVALSGTVGKLGGRLDEVKVTAGSYIDGGTVGYLTKLWMGIQQYYGTITAGSAQICINPKMRAARDTPTIGSVVSGASYFSGSTLQLGTVPGTLSELTTLSLFNHAGGSSSYYIGKWLVLARAKVNSGVVGMQLRWGRTNSLIKTQDTRSICEMVYISGTAFQFYELGNITWPSVPNHGGTVTCKGEKLDPEVQQISGTTTTFQVDALVLIPAAHSVKISNMVTVNPIPRIKLWTFEDGKTLAFNEDNTAQAQFNDFIYPKEGGYLVIAGELFTASVAPASILGSVNIDISYANRYSYFIP